MTKHVNLKQYSKICALSVSLFSIYGCLSRQGLIRLFGRTTLSVSEEPLFSSLGGNIIGSFLMGVLVPIMDFFYQTNTEDLYVGLTTGFCGSLTTFSSMITIAGENVYRFSVVMGFATLAIGNLAPTAGYELGNSFVQLLCLLYKKKNKREISSFINLDANQVLGQKDAETQFNELDMDVELIDIVAPNQVDQSHEQYSEKCEKSVSKHSEKFGWIDSNSNVYDNYVTKCRIAILVSSIFGISVVLLVIAVIFDPNLDRRNHFWLPALLAPIGASIRWLLGLCNNKGNKEGSKVIFLYKIPFGTYLANLTATILTMLLKVIKSHKLLSAVACKVTISGVCGSMSTYSTYVCELKKLSLGCGYIYGAITLSTCFVVTLLLVPLTSHYKKVD